MVLNRFIQLVQSVYKNFLLYTTEYYIQHKADCLESYKVYFEVYAIIYHFFFKFT